jgi:hypothetical protein
MLADQRRPPARAFFFPAFFSTRTPLNLASLNRTCRDHRPDVSAALTTVAFDQSGPRWLGISDLIAEPEGPTFISYKVARRRLNRLRFATQNPTRTFEVAIAIAPHPPVVRSVLDAMKARRVLVGIAGIATGPEGHRALTLAPRQS